MDGRVDAQLSPLGHRPPGLGLNSEKEEGSGDSGG